MADLTTINGIQFLSAHHPALADGEYVFTLEHKVTTHDYVTTPVDPAPPVAESGAATSTTPVAASGTNATTTTDTATPTAAPATPAQPVTSGTPVLLATPLSVETTFNKSLTITVNGPRFKLASSEIHSVFPPVGGSGDYKANLPTIIFTRSTLPWERTPYNDYEGDASWLFLLMVDENKKDGVVEGKYNYTDLSNHSIQKNLGIIDTDDLALIDNRSAINYIMIQNSDVLSTIPKTVDDLQYLSYVRKKPEDGKNEEHSVLICNCLPNPGANTTMYLISLENKFNDAGKLDLTQTVFPYLYKWSFHAVIEQLYTFGNGNLEKAILDTTLASMTNLLKESYQGNKTVFYSEDDFNKDVTAKLKLGANPPSGILKTIRRYCKLPGSLFHEVLSNLKNGVKPLRLPKAQPGKIEISGSVQLPLQIVENEMPFYSMANYRGPLVPGPINIVKAHFSKHVKLHKSTGSQPVFVDNTAGFIPLLAEELVINLDNHNDLTYATAYEIGKLTALNDNDFSKAFFEWKHDVATAKQLNNMPAGIQGSHLAALHKYDPNKPMPDSVIKKFSAWKLLIGLPSRYIIPSPDLFPHESLRYFKIDNNWVNAFICGAFSIGHTVQADFRNELTKLFLHENRSGFIINSLAVFAWPDYELDAYDSAGLTANPKVKLNPLRKANLDKSTHFYIFDTIVNQLNFHLHPGKLHPGFIVEKGTSKKKPLLFKKNNLPNITVNLNLPSMVDVPTKYSDFTTCINKNRVLNIPGLINQLRRINNIKTVEIGKITVPYFNACMMEGTPEVVITING
jgi:hypothetical protein